jgi:uncharacterized membrane protein
MNTAALNETLALGAITGMRSMAGGAALAAAQPDSILKGVVGVMAAGEMILDKTSLVGDRIDPIPLAGRAVMGALVGGAIARRERGNIALGAATGAAAAVVAAHLGFRLRRRLPFSNSVNGLLEDGIVLGIAAAYGNRRQKYRQHGAR